MYYISKDRREKFKAWVHNNVGRYFTTSEDALPMVYTYKGQKLFAKKIPKIKINEAERYAKDYCEHCKVDEPQIEFNNDMTIFKIRKP